MECDRRNLIENFKFYLKRFNLWFIGYFRHLYCDLQFWGWRKNSCVQLAKRWYCQTIGIGKFGISLFIGFKRKNHSAGNGRWAHQDLELRYIYIYLYVYMYWMGFYLMMINNNKKNSAIFMQIYIYDWLIFYFILFNLLFSLVFDFFFLCLFCEILL